MWVILNALASGLAAVRFPTIWIILLLACLLVCGKAQSSELSVNAEPVEPTGTLQFRFVEVLQDELPDVPVGSLKYAPMKQERFERLVREVRERATRPANAFARIERATYFARLEQGRLVHGVGLWEVEHEAEHTVTLLLNDVLLPLRRPRWGEEGNEAVKLGRSSTGDLVALVDRSGSLLFDWSLAAERDTNNVLRFQLQLAQCPATELFLELPVGWIPMVSHGLVQGPLDRSDPRLAQSRGAQPIGSYFSASPSLTVAEPSPAGSGTATVPRPGSVPPGNQIWHIVMGGRHTATLNVLPEQIVRDPRQRISARQNNRIAIDEFGIQEQVEIRLDVRYQPLHQVQLELADGLHITAAEFEGNAVPWSVETQGEEAPTLVVIDFTEPVSGNNLALRLTAFAPNVGRQVSIPWIRPSNLLWQQGTAEIQVAQPLQVAGVQMDGCRPLAPLRRSVPDDADILQLELFRPAPMVKLTLAPRVERVEVFQGTSVRFGESSLSGKSVVDFRCVGGERYGLTARISEQWAIDSIDSEPPGAIADWEQSVATRQLRVRLKKSLEADGNPRVIISGRHPALLAGERLGREDLCFVQFEEVEQADHQVAVNSDVVLKWDGDANWRDEELDELSPEQLSRLVEGTHERVFADDPLAHALAISLSEQETRFSADIQSEIIVSSNRLREIHRIRVDPIFVDKLEIRFSQKLSSTTQWIVTGEPETTLEARRAVPGEADLSPIEDAGETWEVILRRPRRTRFELQAVRSRPWKPGTFISLLSVMNAEQQMATVRVRVAGDEEILIENSHLQAIPVEIVQADPQSSLRAVFRYDPAPHAVASAAHALAISPATSGADHTSLWLRRRDVDSHFDAGGFSRHRVTYELENSASRNLRLTPPADATIRKVAINSADVTATVASGTDQLLIQLPETSSTATLVIELESQRAPLRLLDTLRAPVPGMDVPCLAGQWRVTLPRGYELSNPHRLNAPAPRLSWRHRLFGSWARDDGVAPFSPLSLADWKRLARSAPTVPHETDSAMGVPLTIGLPLASTVTPGCAVHDGRRLEAAGWACLFAMATAIWWLTRTASQLWPLMAAVCAAVAMVVPTPLIPVFSSIFLGALLGGVLVMLPSRRRRPAHAPWRPQASDPTTVRQTMPIVLIWAAVAIVPQRSLAQAKPALDIAQPRKTPTYEVLVPVHEPGQVATEYYHVPEPIYQALREVEAQMQRTAPEWILDRLSLRTRLDWEVPDQRLLMDPVAVVCDLETFAPQQTVRLGFRKSEMQLMGETARLDGRPVPVRWTDEGDALELLVPDAGPFRLEFSLLPSRAIAEPYEDWSFDIPRVPDSTLKIDLPPAPPGLELPGLGGAVDWDEQQHRLSAKFGARDRLTLRWSGSAPGSVSKSLDVEQLFWLRMNPQSVVLDAKITFRVSSGKLRVVQLTTDLRLRMLPLEDDSPIQTVHTLDVDTTQRLLLELKEPADDSLAIHLSFLVTDTRGIGQVAFPRVETEGNVTRRWLAVSGHESLEFPETDASQDNRLPGPEFVRDWGGTQAEPPRAYDHTDDSYPMPAVAIRPVSNESRIAQRLTVVYGPDRADIRLDADILNSQLSQLVHRLDVAEEVIIDEILLSDTDHSIAARWIRSGPRTVQVFPNQWYHAPHRVTMRGHIPIVANQPAEFPRVAMAEGTFESDRIVVGRRSGVSVRWEPTGDHPPVEQTPDATMSLEATRILGAMEIDRSKPWPNVTVDRNEPTANSIQVSRLVRRDERWFLEVDHSVSLDNGFLDELVFDVAEPCQEPVLVQPDLVVNSPSDSGPGRKRLIFHLPEAVHDNFRLKFHLPLAFAPGQRVHVPRVNPINQLNCTHYVVLPLDNESGAMAWDTRWMIPAKLPPELNLSDAAAREPIDGIYVAIEPDFRAEQRPANETGGVPQIRQADIHVYPQAAGTGQYSGQVRFDLEPTGIDRCRIKMSASLRLIHATVGGLPARMRRVDETDWELALVSAWLPQRIEIDFTGNSTPGNYYSTSTRFAAPEVEGIDVQRTLWTVSAPLPQFIGSPDDKEHQITKLTQQIFRLRTMTELMDLSAHVLSEQTAEDVAHWYRNWASRYRALREECQSIHDESAAQELTVRDSRQSQIAAHLGTQSDWESIVEKPAKAPVGNVETNHRHPAHRVSMMFQGSRYSLGFSSPARSRMSTLMRFGMAALLISGVWRLSRSIPLPWTHWAAHAARWPAFHGILLGFSWWLWLSPSWIGVVIASAWLCAMAVASVLASGTQNWNRIILQRRP